MAVAFLLDENIEHRVLHRLEKRGYDVEHVDFVAALGKTATDAALAAYSREHARDIVTYDDDFVTEFDETAFHGVVYLADASLSATEVADILHAMAQAYPESAFEGVEFGSDGCL